MNQRIHCPNPMCPAPNDVQLVSSVASAGDISVRIQTSLSRQLSYREPTLYRCGRFLTGPTFLMLMAVLACPIGMFVAGFAVTFTNDTITLIVLWIAPILLFILSPLLLGSAFRLISTPRRNQTLAKWWQLYYCPHCGSVFNPNENGRYASVGSIKALYT